MKRGKLLFYILIILASFIISSNSVFADTAAEKFKTDLFDTGIEAGYPVEYETSQKLLMHTIAKIIGVILTFVGVIFLVLMIYGGYTWMLARGNEQEVSKARSIVINSLIGVIIVLAGYALTSFIKAIIDIVSAD